MCLGQRKDRKHIGHELTNQKKPTNKLKSNRITPIVCPTSDDLLYRRYATVTVYYSSPKISRFNQVDISEGFKVFPQTEVNQSLAKSNGCNAEPVRDISLEWFSVGNFKHWMGALQERLEFIQMVNVYLPKRQSKTGTPLTLRNMAIGKNKSNPITSVCSQYVEGVFIDVVFSRSKTGRPSADFSVSEKLVNSWRTNLEAISQYGGTIAVQVQLTNLAHLFTCKFMTSTRPSTDNTVFLFDKTFWYNTINHCGSLLQSDVCFG